MDSREVVEAIEEARRAIRQYRDEFEGKSAFAKRSQMEEKEQVEEETELLIKESQRLIAGPSGDPCPCCNGSGRA